MSDPRVSPIDFFPAMQRLSVVVAFASFPSADHVGVLTHILTCENGHSVAAIKKSTNKNAGEGAEKKEPSNTVGGNAN